MAVGERAQVEDARVSAADLYARHANHILRFCLHQLRNRAEAEDAVQTTFLQAFRALQRGTIPHVERAWLIAIAQNVCRTMQRTSARRRDVEADADPELVAGAAGADPPLREEISDLERALTRIPANQRRALVLHEWNGLRYREIAGVMGISQTAVEMLAFRARRSLSQALSAGSSRARQALDVGGIVTALRGLLSIGSSAHALAGVGVAGLALATLGSAPPMPAQAARTVAHTRAVQVARTAVARKTSAPAVSRSRRHRTAVGATDAPARPDASVPARGASPTADASVASSRPAPSTSSPPQATTRVATAPSASSPVSLPASAPTLPVSVPPVTAPLPVTTPDVPSVSLPPLPVSTPAVTLPTP